MNADYLAGFVDGEGCFYYNFRNREGRSPVVAMNMFIANKHLAVLEQIQAVYGGTIRIIKNKHADVYRLEIFNRVALQKVCEDLKDRLVIKRRHAELMYDFCLKYPGHKRTRYKAEDLEAMNEIRVLNGEQRYRPEVV
jgi:hypothetical protein